MEEDDAVHGAPDGGVLVRHHDVGCDATAISPTCLGIASGVADPEGPHKVFHHRAGHRVQPRCRLVVHHHLQQPLPSKGMPLEGVQFSTIFRVLNGL